MQSIEEHSTNASTFIPRTVEECLNCTKEVCNGCPRPATKEENRKCVERRRERKRKANG